MHWIFGAILHATVLGVISFFVLFAASKADGFVALLGRLLGYWLLLLAILGLACGIYGGVTGKNPMPMDDHPGWMHHWGPPPPDGGPASAPPPAKP